MKRISAMVRDGTVPGSTLPPADSGRPDVCHACGQPYLRGISPRRNGLKRRSDQFDARRYTAAGRVDRHVIAIPHMVVPLDHRMPIGQDQARHFLRACFDAATMLFNVRANRSISTTRARARRPASRHALRVSIHGLTESPMTVRPRRKLSSATAYAARYPASSSDPGTAPDSRIACSIESIRSADSAKLLCQCARNRRLGRCRKSRKDNEHNRSTPARCVRSLTPHPASQDCCKFGAQPLLPG